MRKSSSCLIGLRRCVTQHPLVLLDRACATLPLHKTLHFSKELAESLLTCRGSHQPQRRELSPSGPVRFVGVALFPADVVVVRVCGTRASLIHDDAELRQVVGDLPRQVGGPRRTVHASERPEPRGLESSVQDPEPRGVGGGSQPRREDVCGRVLPADREIVAQA